MGKGDNEIPDQTLVPNVAKETLECGSPCSSAPPATEWDKTTCGEYDLDTALEQGAQHGDRSAIQLLAQRHDTTFTRSERLRIAGILLGRVPDDSAYWKELSEYAENAVRFGGEDDASAAAFRASCAEQGVDPAYIYAAYSALDIVGGDRRSHALLLRALESRDQGIAAAAIAGLAAQHDLDSLPAIEKVLQQRPNDARSVALMLTLFESEAADRIALKYIAKDDEERYFEGRH